MWETTQSVLWNQVVFQVLIEQIYNLNDPHCMAFSVYHTRFIVKDKLIDTAGLTNQGPLSHPVYIVYFVNIGGFGRSPASAYPSTY